MKKFIVILLFIAFHLSFSQSSGWFWQNPLPQGNDLANLQFVNSNTAFCISYNYLLKTSDAGSTWQVISSPLFTNNVSLCFADMITGYIVSDSGRVLKSTDSGNSWVMIYDLQNSICHKIYFSDLNTGYVLCINWQGQYYGSQLWRTSNGGSNWTMFLYDTSSILSAIQFTSINTGYAAGSTYPNHYAKVLKTTDGGLNWINLPQTFFSEFKGLLFQNDNTGFAYGFGHSNNTIMRTTNGGVNWISQYAQGTVSYLNLFNGTSGIAFRNEFSMILKSSNSGLNWISTGSVNQILGDNNCSVEFLDINTGIIIGSSGKILKSVNSGLNWSYLSNSQHIDIQAIKFSSPSVAYAVGKGMLKSTNGGSTWFSPNSDSAIIYGGICVDFINDNTGFVGDMNGLLKTTNGGTNWSRVANIPQAITTDVFFTGNTTGYVISKGGGTYKTTNSGLNWNSLPNPFPNPWDIYFGSVYFINDNTGFVAGGLSDMGALSRTTDGGNTWDTTKINNSGMIFDVYFFNENTGIAACANNSASPGTILKSTDGGKVWVNKIVSDAGVFLSLSFVNQLTGYSCTVNGNIAKTTDGGDSWAVYPTITKNELWAVHFINSETGFVAGFGGTILKTTTGGMPIGIQPVSNEIPTGFTLYQNYPNPFNPETVIKFQVPVGDAYMRPLQLRIFDIIGREVATLINEHLQPGKYEVEWNANNFASGVYFYQLVAGDPSTGSGQTFIQTKKMVLLK